MNMIVYLLLLLLLLVNIDQYYSKITTKIYSDDQKRPYTLVNDKGEQVVLSKEQEDIQNAIESFRRCIYMKDTFNATLGLAIVNQLSSSSMIEAERSLIMIATTSLGNVPILHHLMNLYLLNKVLFRLRPLQLPQQQQQLLLLLPILLLLLLLLLLMLLQQLTEPRATSIINRSIIKTTTLQCQCIINI